MTTLRTPPPASAGSWESTDALESQFNFFPKERTPEDVEADFRKDLLCSIELTNDFLNSIDDLLRKLVKAFAHEAARSVFFQKQGYTALASFDGMREMKD